MRPRTFSSACRSCGQEVVFADHARTGRPAPLHRDPDGRWQLVWPTYLLAAPNVPPEHRWTSHFATCPGAAAHRAAANAPAIAGRP